VIHLAMEKQKRGPRVLAEKTAPAADTVKDPTRMIVLKLTQRSKRTCQEE